MMSEGFPIPAPARLPVKITPCPIVEAVLEIRFVTARPWSTLPGLLYAKFSEKYPTTRDLPLAKVPEQIREQESNLKHQPLIQYIGRDFSIQLGPRVISLCTKPDAYPGWQRIQPELAWLLDMIQRCEFIAEGERLATRYINFFS